MVDCDLDLRILSCLHKKRISVGVYIKYMPKACAGHFPVIWLQRFLCISWFGLRISDVSLQASIGLESEVWHGHIVPLILWETSTHIYAFATMLHCVLEFEFSVWGSFDKLSEVLRPQNNNYFFHKCWTISLYPVKVFLGKFVLHLGHFFNQPGLYRKFILEIWLHIIILYTHM